MKASLLIRWISVILGSGFLVGVIALSSPALASAIPRLPHANQPATSVPSPPSEEQRLQIKQLEQETGWQGQLRGYLPAGSALVAFGAALWGAIIYFRDQRRDRALRTEQAITENLNQIISYSKGETTTSAQAVCSLDNLNALADQSTNKDMLRKRVTNVIVAAVMEDIDFNNVRQVGFDVLCIDKWPPYVGYIESHPDEGKYVVYRYLSALYGLRDRQREYMATVNYDIAARKFVHPNGTVMRPEDDFRLFQRAIQGVRQHWQMLDDITQRSELINTFADATNRNLAGQLFGKV